MKVKGIVCRLRGSPLWGRGIAGLLCVVFELVNFLVGYGLFNQI